MDDNERQVAFYKSAIIENICTVFAAAICVGLLAVGTGSMHSLWGLVILLNLNNPKFKKNSTID